MENKDKKSSNSQHVLCPKVLGIILMSWPKKVPLAHNYLYFHHKHKVDAWHDATACVFSGLDLLHGLLWTIQSLYCLNPCFEIHSQHVITCYHGTRLTRSITLNLLSLFMYSCSFLHQTFADTKSERILVFK